ncbi:MAG: methyltransferase domain-containing protein [Candidatus Hodarchaeales archaeon]
MNNILSAKEISTSPKNQKMMYALGLLALILNKLRRSLKEYSSPRPFVMSGNIDKNVNYVLKVVNRWQEVARMYSQQAAPFLNKSILEIGPGPDLGTGIVLLALGAKRYQAIDMFPLAQNTPPLFYNKLFETISNYPMLTRAKKSFLEFIEEGKDSDFGYKIVVFPWIADIREEKYDIIVSQAVWEHISDPETTLHNLTKYARHGALFINEVDLATHTRIIRDIDPLNILRYNKKIYQKLSFPGIPNRLRSSDFQYMGNRIGLKDIRIIPIKQCSTRYVEEVKIHLASPYKEKEVEDLSILSCFWLGRFP